VLLQQTAALPSSASIAVVVAVLVALAWRLRSFAAAGCAAGFVWTAVCADTALDARLPDALDGRDFAVTGWIDALPSVNDSGVAFSMRVDGTNSDLAGARLRLNWYEPRAAVAPGQRVEAVVRLRAPHGFANPAGFDYERWLMQEGFSATGYVRSGRMLGRAQRDFRAAVLSLRARLASQLRENVTSERARALVAALGLGDRSAFSQAQWETFRRTGTSHLVAISGLHIALLAGAIFAALSMLLRRCGGRWTDWQLELACLGALIAAAAYALLAGFALPTRRALVMLGAAFVAMIARRQGIGMSALAVAALVVLAFDPLATLSPSFWLSFGAVTILLASAVARRASYVPESRGRRIVRATAAIARMQVALTLALIPLGAVFFGSVSLVAAPVNLFAIPVFSFVVIPLVLATMAVLVIWPGADWVLHAADHVCGWADTILQSLARLSWAELQVAAPPPLALCVALGGVMLALSWHRSRGRHVVWLAVLLAMVPIERQLPAGTVEASVLDVGHGLAVVIETRSHRLLFDAGARFASGFDVGADIVAPALAQRRDKRLDLLVISHADNDHSGGADAVLKSFPQASVLRGVDVQIEGSQICAAGERWSWDGVDFEILYPETGYDVGGNDASCVLLVTAGRHRMLLTGDIERRGESALAGLHGLTADVVVVPHHGSATSSSDIFVERISARAAIVSAGYRNRWGFPVPAVRERWERAGADVYVTGERGAVLVRIDGASIEIATERMQRPHYWRVPPG
jgi:competence protein ComEC